MVVMEAQICRKFSIPSLRDNQRSAIKAVVEKRYVFVGTKAGSGKSLTYGCIPVVCPGYCVVIITPLLSIMNEQCMKLKALGFRAPYIGKDSRETENLLTARFNFVYGSPENIVGDRKWRTFSNRRFTRINSGH
jgi:superfamily II DNA helicase RecQ